MIFIVVHDATKEIQTDHVSYHAAYTMHLSLAQFVTAITTCLCMKLGHTHEDPNDSARSA